MSCYVLLCLVVPGFDSGADPLIRAGPPGPAFPQIDNSEEADEGVGCGPEGPPHKTSEVRAPSSSGDFQSQSMSGISGTAYRSRCAESRCSALSNFPAAAGVLKSPVRISRFVALWP